MNTVDSLEEIKQQIIDGKWDLVLNTLRALNLNPVKLFDLYEQVLIFRN
jgi:hypothetical protein